MVNIKGINIYFLIFVMAVKNCIIVCFFRGQMYVFVDLFIRRYFQHAHFIPIVGMGKRWAY